MRILMLSPYPNIRGPIRKIAAHLVAALRPLGCKVTMESWGRHSEVELLRDKLVGRGQDILRIRRTLQRATFDMLVVQTTHEWASLSRDIPLLLAVRHLCPYRVLEFHGGWTDWLVGPGHKLFKAASAWLIRLGDAAMLLSSEERRQWQAFYSGGKFYVVSNPFVSASGSLPIPDTKCFHLPKGSRVLLFVGRLTESKGIFDLLNALPEVLTQVQCHLLVVGDGAQAEQVRQRVMELDLRERVTLAGHLQGDALLSAYCCADVFVLPSWWEGFPVVIAEAMDAGLPVVTIRIRGMADHLSEGVNALFVPPRNPVALAAALKQLLLDPALRGRIGQANREKVKEFAPQVVGKHYLNVLREVTRRGEKCVV